MSESESPKKPAKKAAPKRNVLCEVIQAGGIALPSKPGFRLGRGHREALTKDEADVAVALGIIRIIGLA